MIGRQPRIMKIILCSGRATPLSPAHLQCRYVYDKCQRFASRTFFTTVIYWSPVGNYYLVKYLTNYLNHAPARERLSTPYP